MDIDRITLFSSLDRIVNFFSRSFNYQVSQLWSSLNFPIQMQMIKSIIAIVWFENFAPVTAAAAVFFSSFSRYRTCARY